MQGKQPFWPERLRRNLLAVVKRLGIEKRVGWHTFRHTLSTMLRANGEDIAKQAELLRNSQTVALEHYAQSIPESKRAAQARVLELIIGEDSANDIAAHGRFAKWLLGDPLISPLEFLYFGQKQCFLPLSAPRLGNEFGIQDDIACAELHGAAAYKQIVIFFHR